MSVLKSKCVEKLRTNLILQIDSPLCMNSEKFNFWSEMLGMGNFEITMLDIVIKFGKAWRFVKRL